jgi:hypothetical protein
MPLFPGKAYANVGVFLWFTHGIRFSIRVLTGVNIAAGKDGQFDGYLPPFLKDFKRIS